MLNPNCLSAVFLSHLSAVAAGGGAGAPSAAPAAAPALQPVDLALESGEVLDLWNKGVGCSAYDRTYTGGAGPKAEYVRKFVEPRGTYVAVRVLPPGIQRSPLPIKFRTLSFPPAQQTTTRRSRPR